MMEDDCAIHSERIPAGDPRYAGFRIERLWLFTAVDPEDNQEGVIPAGGQPLMAADERRLHHAREAAQAFADTYGLEARALLFESRRVFETYTPGEPLAELPPEEKSRPEARPASGERRQTMWRTAEPVRELTADDLGIGAASQWFDDHSRVVEFVHWAWHSKGLDPAGVFARFEKPWHFEEEYREYRRLVYGDAQADTRQEEA